MSSMVCCPRTVFQSARPYTGHRQIVRPRHFCPIAGANLRLRDPHGTTEPLKT
jgi:hypothetical protein